jgi:branched-chain amino acid transport system substrate-binding protein
MKRCSKTLIIMAVSLVLISLAFVGCKKEAEVEKVVKIGCSVSMSGKMAPEGTNVKRGVEIWEEHVNSKGGIKVGDDMYKVEVVYYDDKSDAGTGTKLTEKLITEDKVDFLFGPFSSGITFATTAIGEKYGVITVAPEANATQVYERGYKNVFSILPPAPALTQPIFDMIDSLDLDPEPKTLAVIVSNDLFPLSCAEGALEKAEELGLEVVLYEKYPADTTDVSALLSLVKDKNPDIFLTSGYTKDALMVMRQAREINLNVKLFATSVGVVLPEFIPSLGPDANYVVEGEWWLASGSDKGPVFGSTPEYVKMFEAKYGETPGYHAASGSAAGVVLQLAIEKAGTLDTDAVREALRGLDVVLAVWPGVKFNEKGQNVSAEHPVVQVQNEAYAVVWPPQDELMYPTPSWADR